MHQLSSAADDPDMILNMRILYYILLTNSFFLIDEKECAIIVLGWVFYIRQPVHGPWRLCGWRLVVAVGEPAEAIEP